MQCCFGLIWDLWAPDFLDQFWRDINYAQIVSEGWKKLFRAINFGQAALRAFATIA